MTSHRYFYGIDIIRFFSAISVMSFHFGYVSEAANFKPIWACTWFGWVGVEIFFVISGFVIANSARGVSATEFLRGRILRLYPAVWLCATLTFFVRMPDNLLSPFLRSIALFPKGPWISSVYWTLAVEISFYSLLFLLLCLKAFSWIGRVALILTIFSTCYLTIVALRIGAVSDHINVFLLRHGCFFAVGIWLWLATTRPLKPWERIALAGSIAPCILEICLTGITFLPNQVISPAWIFIPALFWGSAVASIWFSSQAKCTIHPKITSFVRTLGLMTYPLYLVHDELGHWLIGNLISIGTNKWLALAIGAAAIIGLSWLICTLWEPKIRGILGTIFDRMTLGAAMLACPVRRD